MPKNPYPTSRWPSTPRAADLFVDVVRRNVGDITITTQYDTLWNACVELCERLAAAEPKEAAVEQQA